MPLRRLVDTARFAEPRLRSEGCCGATHSARAAMIPSSDGWTRFRPKN